MRSVSPPASRLATAEPVTPFGRGGAIMIGSAACELSLDTEPGGGGRSHLMVETPNQASRNRAVRIATASLCAAALVVPLVATAAEGSATWTYENPDNSEYHFSITLYDDDDPAIRIWGTHPPTSEFPIAMTNGDGDILRIALDSGDMVHTGEFEVDFDASASDCADKDCDANDTCGISLAGHNCEETTSGCIDYECGGGGGVTPVGASFVIYEPY